MRDNLDTKILNGEVHYADAIEEKISLADRFGLRLSFYPQNSVSYLEIVDTYFSDYQGNKAVLHKAALDFAHQNAAKNGRTAKQFYIAFTAKTAN
jgi:predicted AAA+ superfamily ATPase